MIHRERTHPQFVEGCYGCKISTVALFGPDGSTAGKRKFSKQVARDLEAYKKAKDNGLQPPTSTVAGVEKAEKQAEAEESVKKKFGVKDLKELKPDWSPV